MLRQDNTDYEQDPRQIGYATPFFIAIIKVSHSWAVGGTKGVRPGVA